MPLSKRAASTVISAGATRSNGHPDPASMTTAVSDLRSAVQAAVTQVVEAESLHLETLVAEAVRLQDYDRLDHLVIVDQVGHPRTVASMLDL